MSNLPDRAGHGWSPPRLYAILDVEAAQSLHLDPRDIADAWLDAGVRLIQLRAKPLSFGPMTELAADLAARARSASATFIVNDRPDVAVLAGADGVHVGQDDLGPADVKAIAGPGALVGLSTHHEEQVRAAVTVPVSYLAIGPVYQTTTKVRPDPVVGVDGVRRAKEIAGAAGVPLVAIGGLTPDRAAAVLGAGAASLAVASSLLDPDPGAAARRWLAAVQ